MVKVCRLTAYKACKLYNVKSDTLIAHLRGKVKSEVKGRNNQYESNSQFFTMAIVIMDE